MLFIFIIFLVLIIFILKNIPKCQENFILQTCNETININSIKYTPISNEKMEKLGNLGSTLKLKLLTASCPIKFVDDNGKVSTKQFNEIYYGFDPKDVSKIYPQAVKVRYPPAKKKPKGMFKKIEPVKPIPMVDNAKLIPLLFASMKSIKKNAQGSSNVATDINTRLTNLETKINPIYTWYSENKNKSFN